MELLIKLAKSNTAPRLLVTMLLAVFLLQNSNNHAGLERVLSGWQLSKTAQEPNVILATLESKASTNYKPTPGKNPSSGSQNSKDKQAKPDYTDLLTELAKTDHITLLKKAQENYQLKVNNFTGNLSKQERIKGKLKKEENVLFVHTGGSPGLYAYQPVILGEEAVSQ